MSTIIETPTKVSAKIIRRPINKEAVTPSPLTLKFNALSETEEELKNVAKECLALEITGEKDTDGYKVARAALTSLISSRTGIDKTAEPYFDLVNKARDTGKNKVDELKALIKDAEIYLGSIVKTWKDNDDARKLKAKLEKEKLIKDRTIKLEAAGAILKGGFFILDEISISVETIKKQKEERFEIIVEEFEEKRDELAALAQERMDTIIAIDPNAKVTLALLSSHTEIQFEEYKELVELRKAKNDTKEEPTNKDVVAVVEEQVKRVIGSYTGKARSKEDVADINAGKIEDIKEENQKVMEPNELLGLWFKEISETCNQDLSVYKSPEREILKNCKKSILKSFTKAFAEMKNNS